MPRPRRIQDAHILRAMAHPLRLRLLGLLRKEGPATASAMARRLGESSGATSYHLRQLAKYGFVEEAAERNRGRQKHWRAVDEGTEWSADTDDAGVVEAGSALGRQVVAEYARWLSRWYAETPAWDRNWRAAAEGFDQWFELTPDELRGLSDEVMSVLERYAVRRTRRDDTERAIVLFHAFPERREAA
ncbi:MAG TPA: helix-turn-helix domain-containing protein [Thermoleophilaceae bacterium]|nr:helix-turn-helix domain-containing protein [Thermoleophilaceae bacterium]